MKGDPKPSPFVEVSNDTTGQPGCFIGESGASHGLVVIAQNMEISRSVDSLFSLDRTLVNSIAATAPMCLQPADFWPLGEWMSRNLVIPQLANNLNATSLVLPFLDVTTYGQTQLGSMLQSSSLDLSFPNMATYEQFQHIESENLELEKLDLVYYNSSFLFSPNEAIKKKLPTGFRRPSVIFTCKRAILS